MLSDMNTRKNVRRALIGAACGAVIGAAAAGCQNDRSNDIHGEMFPADGDVRSVDRFAEVQSAAAARADATLTASHFDEDGGLNSLGRSKLDLMLRDDDASSAMVVYLDVRGRGNGAGNTGGSGATQFFDAHRYEDGARRHLADRGVGDARVEFRQGPNVGYTHPAREGLRGLSRLNGDDGKGDSDGPGVPLLNMSPAPEKPKR